VDWLVNNVDPLIRALPSGFENRVYNLIPCSLARGDLDHDGDTDEMSLRQRLECFYEEQVIANAEPQRMAGTAIHLGGAGGRLSPNAAIQILGVEVGNPGNTGDPEHLHIHVRVDPGRRLPDLTVHSFSVQGIVRENGTVRLTSDVRYGQEARALIRVGNLSPDLEAGYNFRVRMHEGTDASGALLGEMRVPLFTKVGDRVTLPGGGPERTDAAVLELDFTPRSPSQDIVAAVIDASGIVVESNEANNLVSAPMSWAALFSAVPLWTSTGQSAIDLEWRFSRSNIAGYLIEGAQVAGAPPVLGAWQTLAAMPGNATTFRHRGTAICPNGTGGCLPDGVTFAYRIRPVDSSDCSAPSSSCSNTLTATSPSGTISTGEETR